MLQVRQNRVSKRSFHHFIGEVQVSLRALAVSWLHGGGGGIVELWVVSSLGWASRLLRRAPGSRGIGRDVDLLVSRFGHGSLSLHLLMLNHGLGHLPLDHQQRLTVLLRDPLSMRIHAL